MDDASTPTGGDEDLGEGKLTKVSAWTSHSGRPRRMISIVLTSLVLIGAPLSAPSAASPPASSALSDYVASAGTGMMISASRVLGLTTFEVRASQGHLTTSHVCVEARRVAIRSTTIDGRKAHIKTEEQEFGCATSGFDYSFDPLTWTGTVRAKIPTEVTTVIFQREQGQDRWGSKSVQARAAATAKLDIVWQGTRDPQPHVQLFSRAVAVSLSRDASAVGSVTFGGLSAPVVLPSDFPGKMWWGATAGLCC